MMAIAVLAAKLFQRASRSKDSLIRRLTSASVKMNETSIPTPRLVAAPLMPKVGNRARAVRMLVATLAVVATEAIAVSPRRRNMPANALPTTVRAKKRVMIWRAVDPVSYCWPTNKDKAGFAVASSPSAKGMAMKETYLDAACIAS